MLLLVWVNVVLWILTTHIAYLFWHGCVYYDPFSCKFLVHFHTENGQVTTLAVDCWFFWIVTCFIPRRKARDVIHVQVTGVFLWFFKHAKIYWWLLSMIYTCDCFLLSYIMVIFFRWSNLFFLKKVILVIHFRFYDFNWCWVDYLWKYSVFYSCAESLHFILYLVFLLNYYL